MQKIGSSSYAPPEDFLRKLAEKMRLKEGEEAIRRVLREIHHRGKVGTKDIARATRLPTPVTAAIRRELEKAGLVARKGGAILTVTGKEFVEVVLGMVAKTKETNDSQEIAPEYEPILEKSGRHHPDGQMPTPNWIRPTPLLKQPCGGLFTCLMGETLQGGTSSS